MYQEHTIFVVRLSELVSRTIRFTWLLFYDCDALFDAALLYSYPFVYARMHMHKLHSH